MQDTNRILRNSNHLRGCNNIENIVEEVLVQSGLKFDLHRLNCFSPFPNYIRQEELPRGCKVPKFTKFACEKNDSTIEHISRFETKAGDIANDEGLKLRYFPSLLTKIRSQSLQL